MDISEARTKVEILRSQIWEANKAYFNENRELFPESVRDQMKKELIVLETLFPELITPDSPTQRVGYPLSGKLPKILHKSRRYSLSDVFSEEELRDFDQRVKRFLKISSLEYSCERKIDGINITLWYEKGVLTKALTRGDGSEGEDVTHTIRTCENLPLYLPHPLDLEVSGECFIAKEDFLNLQKNFSEEKFANARNLTAGTVRQLDPKVASDRHLRIFLYEAYGTDARNQTELFSFFEKLGLPYEKNFQVFSDMEEVILFCRSWEDTDARNRLWYDIDGVVVKVHDFSLRERLGYTSKTAKYAVAWKFPAEKKYTRVLDIHFQVGRTGAVTPVAILEPVEIAGSTISRATLHNADEMERKKVLIGDTVIIHKAGDIIPEILEVLPRFRTGEEKIVSFPTLCPECGTVLSREEIIVRCPNTDCPARHREGLLHFAKSLDIEGLGEKTIQALIDLDLLKTPPDLWKLDHFDLALVPGFKHRRVFLLLDALLAKKKILLSEIFMGLGIRLVGEENSKIFARFFRDKFGEFSLFQFFSLFSSLSKEDFLHIDGIGEKVAESFYSFLKSDYAQKVFQDFLSLGIDIYWEPIGKNLRFLSQKFVITGTFESFSRDELKKIIVDQGGKVLSAVSQNVDALLYGKNPGSKFRQAEELGIPLWDEAKIIDSFGISPQKHSSFGQKDSLQDSLF